MNVQIILSDQGVNKDVKISVKIKPLQKIVNSFDFEKKLKLI